MAKAPVPRHGDVRPSKKDVFVTHLLAESILARALPRFEAAGVDVLPVKGIVTAGLLYDDVSERPITDIDLRIRPRDLERALEVGKRAGWTLLRYSRPYLNVVFRTDGLSLDVEASIGPPGLCAIDVGDMITRARRVESPYGYRYLEPELHDHAVVLCVNAFKDKLSRCAPWAVSDVERIARLPAFDPDRFIEAARRGAALSMAWIVADWMAEERGVAAWRTVRDRIGAAPRAVYARLYRALQRRDDNSLPLRLLTRAASDAPWLAARAIATAALWELDTRLADRKARRAGARA
jgi:hypothetical protein